MSLDLAIIPYVQPLTPTEFIAAEQKKIIAKNQTLALVIFQKNSLAIIPYTSLLSPQQFIKKIGSREILKEVASFVFKKLNGGFKKISIEEKTEKVTKSIFKQIDREYKTALRSIQQAPPVFIKPVMEKPRETMYFWQPTPPKKNDEDVWHHPRQAEPSLDDKFKHYYQNKLPKGRRTGTEN